MFVAKSKIHGLGLFARKAMKKGHEYHITLNRVSNAEYNRTTDEEAELFLYDKHLWDLRDSDYRYLNHSFYPNLEWYEAGDKIRIEVLKDIEKNKELTIDYRWDEEDFEE